MKKLLLSELPEAIKKEINKPEAIILNVRAYIQNGEMVLTFHTMDKGILMENCILNFKDLLK